MAETDGKTKKRWDHLSTIMMPGQRSSIHPHHRCRPFPQDLGLAYVLAMIASPHIRSRSYPYRRGPQRFARRNESFPHPGRQTDRQTHLCSLQPYDYRTRPQMPHVQIALRVAALAALRPHDFRSGDIRSQLKSEVSSNKRETCLIRRQQ